MCRWQLEKDEPIGVFRAHSSQFARIPDWVPREQLSHGGGHLTSQGALLLQEFLWPSHTSLNRLM